MTLDKDHYLVSRHGAFDTSGSPHGWQLIGCEIACHLLQRRGHDEQREIRYRAWAALTMRFTKWCVRVQNDTMIGHCVFHRASIEEKLCPYQTLTL